VGKLRRGIAEEYLYKNKLQKSGNFVFRVAGSLSPADLIVVTKDKVKFIQVKSTKKKCYYFSRFDIEEWKNLKKLKEWNPNIEIEFVIIFKRGMGKKPRIVILRPSVDELPKKVEIPKD